MARLYAGVFWWFFLKEGSSLLEKGVYPEFHFSPEDLDNISLSEAEKVRQKLIKSSASSSIHVPYIDVSLSVRDPFFVDAVKRRMVSITPLVELLSPSFVVVHGGYDPLRFDSHEDVWFGPFLNMLEFLLCLWDVRVLIENTFEWHPSTLLRVKKALGDGVGFCFDVAHAFIYGRVPPEYWIEALDGSIEEVHLSDNRGVLDDHLPLGMGSIGRDLFIKALSIREAAFTIEVFREDLFWEGVSSLVDLYRVSSLSRP